MTLASTKADITLPRAVNDKLIFVASFSRSPVAPVYFKIIIILGIFCYSSIRIIIVVYYIVVFIVVK